MRWKDSVWEELLWAATGMALVATIVSVLYWAFSGLSPWPFVVGAEVGRRRPRRHHSHDHSSLPELMLMGSYEQ